LLVSCYFSECSCPTENKIDDVKDSFCEELECIFNKSPKYHMTILFGDFNAKIGREDFLN
jgi:exonuclease III